MKTLYLYGTGNPEGVRLALNCNKAKKRWNRIVLLDDDPAKRGNTVMGIEVIGTLEKLKEADPNSDEIVNMVAKNTKIRQFARQKIQEYGVSLTSLIDPNIDMGGVEVSGDVAVYANAMCCATSRVEGGSMILMRAIVGHGSHLSPDCIVAPGAVVNARVEVGEGVYVGSNASILPDIKVGPWAVIGANAAVVTNDPSGATVMGVPAQILIPGIEEDAPGGKDEISDDALKNLSNAKQRFIESQKNS